VTAQTGHGINTITGIPAFSEIKKPKPPANNAAFEQNAAQKRLRPAILAILSMFLFVSCATKGDFGRERPSVFKDEILPSIRNFFAQSQGKPTSSFALTEKEQLLRLYYRRIGRDMTYPTVESYYTATVASVGLAEAPLPHLGEEIRSNATVVKPVVDVPENAKNNPYALIDEIAEDIVIIGRANKVSRSIIADDQLRLQRLAALRNPSRLDRDNVAVRVKENRRQIEYIRHVAKLRVQRYERVIDVMSIADPTIDLKPARSAVKNLDAEISRYIHPKKSSQL